MLYGGEVSCLVQNEIGILQVTERIGESYVDKKFDKNLMQILDLR